MKRKSLLLSLVIALLFVAACSPAAEPEPAPPAATPPAADSAPAASGDPLTGTWTGDWGPSARDRNPVVLELKYDGTTLTGVVNPGPNAITLSKAAYDPATGAVTMEADAQSRSGATIHYVIEGRVDGNAMMGSWGHDAEKGDFRITKS